VLVGVTARFVTFAFAVLPEASTVKDAVSKIDVLADPALSAAAVIVTVPAVSDATVKVALPAPPETAATVLRGDAPVTAVPDVGVMVSVGALPPVGVGSLAVTWIDVPSAARVPLLYFAVTV
jgi:hypothetical protein